MSDLQKIFEKDGVEFYSYTPSLSNLYFDCYKGEDVPPYFSRIIHRIRMSRELIFAGFQVIYMKKDCRIIGHLVVSRGGTRIAMSNREDIVIGPIWIVPNMRGQGLGSTGIDTVLHNLGFKYNFAYEYIEDDNIASIKTVEKNGYEFVCRCKEFGPLKTIKPCENGNILVYRYK